MAHSPWEGSQREGHVDASPGVQKAFSSLQHFE